MDVMKIYLPDEEIKIKKSLCVVKDCYNNACCFCRGFPLCKFHEKEVK
jgi:hypothetical protein